MQKAAGEQHGPPRGQGRSRRGVIRATLPRSMFHGAAVMAVTRLRVNAFSFRLQDKPQGHVTFVLSYKHINGV